MPDDTQLDGSDSPEESAMSSQAQPMSEQTPIGGSSTQAPPKAPPPVGAAVHQRHGGLITGLAGVLLDGLSAAITTPDGPNQSAETAQKAMDLPQQRQQKQIAFKTQQEMLKAQIAQAHVQQSQTRLLASSLDDEIASGMSDAAWKFATNSVTQGTAKMVSGTGTREAAFSKLKEMHDQAPPDSQGNLFAYPSGKAKDGTAEWAVYETYPSKSLQEDTDFDLPGTKDQGGDIEDLHKSFPAGTPMSVYTTTTAQLMRDHVAKIHAESQANKQQKDPTGEEAAYQQAVQKNPKLDRLTFHKQWEAAKPTPTTTPADRKGAETEIGKHFKDYSDADRQADHILTAISQASDGNQLAAQLVPLENTLFITSAAGVKRVNQTELDMSKPNAGSIVRNAEARLAKSVSGSLPAGYISDIKALVRLYKDSNLAKYKENADSVNERYGTNIPYGLPKTRESAAADRAASKKTDDVDPLGIR